MWERIYKEWLPVSDYELIPDYDIENYLPGDPSSRDYVSEICIPVRKSKSCHNGSENVENREK